jgi:hypothetical protein
MYTLTDPEKKNYFEDALETPGMLFARNAERKLKTDTLEGSIAAANESEMFDSDFAAYEQMAKQLRDSLPEAMKSDVQMKAWEARLAQANAYLESSKAYYTKNYALYDQNMQASQGANPAELESRGLKDAHSASDYDEEMLLLNNRNMFTVTVDENGQFVMQGGSGLNDHFDEEHFRQDLVATDIRQPETYWPEHGTEAMPENQEDLEKEIYGKIVNDPLEKINAERWYKDKRGIESKVELNEGQRDEAYRQYAEAAAADAFKEPEEEVTPTQEAQTAVLDGNFRNEDVSSDYREWSVDYSSGRPVINSVYTPQESFVTISSQNAEAVQVDLNPFQDNVIEDPTRMEAYDTQSRQMIRTYQGGLDQSQGLPNTTLSPNKISMVNRGEIRLYFNMGSNYPEPRVRYITVVKGTADWRELESQVGEEFINDLYGKLEAGY